jgi:hypothetical protein
MSILQEYEKIKSYLREGEFEAIERYLALHPDLLLSDIYYNLEEHRKFDAWWQAEQALNKAYQKYLRQWYADHKGSEYQGMEPVCFDEFIHNEYLEGDY